MKIFHNNNKKKRIWRFVHYLVNKNEYYFSREDFNRLQNKFQLTENICYFWRRKSRKRYFSFFFIEKVISFFEETNFLFITRRDWAYFILSSKNVLKFIHNENHIDYARCYDKIFVSYYIRELFKYFRNYLKHCSKCLIYQTKRHRFYDSFQFIFTSLIFFHIIIMNFMLTFFKSRYDFDCVMSITCKFIKSVTVIFNNVK